MPTLDLIDRHEARTGRRYRALATDSQERWHAFAARHPQYVPGVNTLMRTVHPEIAPEVRRDDYSMTFILRVRRSWPKMTAEARQAALLAGADQLEEYARQMREEAEELVP